MIKLNVSVKDLENEDSLVTIARQILFIQLGIVDNEYYKIANKEAYYDGGKGKFNLTKPLIDLSKNTFLGTMPDLVSSSKYKSEAERISFLERQLRKKKFDTEIYQSGFDSANTGSGFIELYHDLGDTFTSYKRLDPKYTNIVKDCTTAEKTLFAFKIVPVIELNGKGQYTTTHNIYIYTDEKMYALKSFSASFSRYDQIKVELAYVFRTSLATGMVQKYYSMFHGYKGIPIIEIPNNYFRKGDAECVYDLIDAYNELQNNRIQNIKDLVNYLLLIKNARVGDEEEAKLVKKNIIENRILAIEGDNVDAKFLTNPLNQDQIQTLAKSIKEDIERISSVPDVSGKDFSQNASDPILKIKTLPLIYLCSEKTKWFTPALFEILRMTLQFAKDYDKDNSKMYDIELEKIDLNYHIKLPSNDADMITMITNLQNSRMANPKILLGQLSFVKDVETYMEGMEKWNESVDISRQNNKNNIVNNENNIQKQNSERPVNKDMFDNKDNANLGLANRLSDNKVE